MVSLRFFIIDLVPPQIYNRLIRMQGAGYCLKIGAGSAGSGGVKLATKKRRNIIGDTLSSSSNLEKNFLKSDKMM